MQLRTWIKKNTFFIKKPWHLQQNQYNTIVKQKGKESSNNKRIGKIKRKKGKAMNRSNRIRDSTR